VGGCGGICGGGVSTRGADSTRVSRGPIDGVGAGVGGVDGGAGVAGGGGSGARARGGTGLVAGVAQAVTNDTITATVTAR